MPTSTLLPLETWRENTGYMPFHFWQLANSKVPLNSACNTLLKEFSWQSTDASGREDIRKAVAQAESQLRKYLGYDPAPVYHEETIDAGFLSSISGPPAYPPGYFPNTGWPWWSKTPAMVTLEVGKLKRIGTLAWEKVADVAVTISDDDGDGLFDTFTTAPVADGVTPLDDFGLFFSSGDLPAQNANDPLEDWDIRPATFSRNAGLVTATGPSWIVVKPRKYRGVVSSDYTLMGVDSSGALDPDTLANYVATVGLYKKTWTKTNTAYIDLDACGTVSTLEVCATVIDHQLGTVELDLTNVNLYSINCAAPNPQRVRVNYEAGDDLPDAAVVITRLALAELRHRICACEKANKEWEAWAEDLAVIGSLAAGGGGNSKRVANRHLENPLGTRRGHVYAWDWVLNNRLLRATNPPAM